MKEEEKDGPWSRATFILGCFVAPVLVLLLIVTVAANWGKFAAFADSAANSYRDMQAVQERIEAQYPSREVAVELQRRSSVSGTILRLEITDPRFLEGLDDAGRRRKAFEIATSARDVLPPERRYENYEIAFIRHGPFGLYPGSVPNVREERALLFAADELPP